MAMRFKRIFAAALAAALALLLCGCTGLMDPPVVSEAQQVVQDCEYFRENGFVITYFDFKNVQTNRVLDYQHVGYYYVEAENDTQHLTEEVLIVWDYDTETGEWVLNTLEHQNQQFEELD